MRPFKDLSGQTFGRWTALTRTENITQGGQTKIVYICKCACGTIKAVPASHLTSGHSNSCGCLRAEMTHKRCFVDLTGQTFGRWYVLGVDLDRTGTLTWFRCQCSCGGVKSVVAKSLSNGASKSCGCFAREVSGRPRPYREHPSRVKNLTNRRFGRLVVRSIVDRNRLGVRWSCDCDCGKTKLVRGSYLINGTVKSCGCLADESRVANGKANAEDLSNRIFGLLTVLRPTDKRTPYPTEYIIWDCMCECGNRCEIASKDLKNGTKSCGCVRPHVFIGSVRATKAEFPHLSTDLINGISIARARFCQQIGPTMTKTLRRYIRNANKREERKRSK